MADWSNLPKELLGLIAQRLESAFYIHRFRSVCSSWRSSVSIPHQRQLIYLPNDGILDPCPSFHLSFRTVFLIGSPNSVPETNRGSWLVKIEEDGHGRMELLNPLASVRIKSLPDDFPKVLSISEVPIIELGREFVLRYIDVPPFIYVGFMGSLYNEKVVSMCLNSKSDDFVLLTIHVSGRLTMFKSCDKRWSVIPDMLTPYDDVIVFKGKFYAVDNTGRTVVVDLCTNVCLAAEAVFGGDKKFLVESEGELLLVDLYLSVSSDQELGSDHDLENGFHVVVYERTVKFIVFKLDGAGKKWHEVESLRNRVLFLGDDKTFSLSVSELGVCKGNCIVFTDNFFNMNGGEDCVFKGRIAVFDLDDGRISPLADFLQYCNLFWPPPDWIKQTAV